VIAEVCRATSSTPETGSSILSQHLGQIVGCSGMTHRIFMRSWPSVQFCTLQVRHSDAQKRETPVRPMWYITRKDEISSFVSHPWRWAQWLG
jgi:hypothetical protein